MVSACQGGRLVANSAPQIDDHGAPVEHAASPARFAPPREVVREGFAYALEAGADRAFDPNGHER